MTAHHLSQGPDRSASIASWAILFLCAVVLAWAPSSQSLWIDEGHTAHFAQQADFQSVVDALTRDVNSQAQMPGYIVAAWSADKILGSSEWAMRAQNILWAWIALIFCWLTGRHLKIPWLPLLLTCSPFLWFYMDEARPYVMQIAGGSAMAYALSRFTISNAFDWAFALPWILGGLLMSTASMLGGFCFGAATLVVAFLAFRNRPGISRGVVLFLIGGYFVMLLLGAYFAWTVLRGAGGAKLWTVSIGNIAFAFYELLGFSGLGPGRLTLREAAKSGLGDAARALVPFALGLSGLGVLLGVVLLFASRCKPGVARAVLAANLATLVIGISTLAVAAYLAKWPFWGRHFAPFLPFMLVAIAAAIQGTRFPQVLRYTVLVGIFCFWSVSALSIRLLERHLKDDYRRGAQIASSAISSQKTTWWAADETTARYYQLPVSETADSQSALVLYMPEASRLNALAPPDTIVLSRPDQFDALGSIREYITTHGYQKTASFAAFTVWEKPAG